MSMGGALAAPATALHLRLEHAADRSAVVAQDTSMTYEKYPPLQAPGELQPDSGIIEQVKKANANRRE